MTEEKGKTYYWLKLKRDFFKRHDIRIVESMPNGKDYVLFYLKLLLESIDHEGRLRFSETIPYDDEMLSIITNTNIDIVRSAMNMFQQLEMVEVLEDSTIYMAECEKMVGSASSDEQREQWRIRQQRRRDKLRLESGSVTSRDNHVTTSLETEKETELEKEIDIEQTTSMVDLLSEAEWCLLEEKLGSSNLVELIDELDGNDLSKISNPYSYVIHVAKRKGMIP